MPDRVRDLVHSARTLLKSRTNSSKALRELLKWPSSARVNRILLFAVPPLLVSWPVFGALFDEYYQQRELIDWPLGIVLFLGALSGSSGFFLLAKAQVSLRRAVGLIFATFHATPPTTFGGYGCRTCGALLPIEAESPLATCIYCKADNVIGIDLRGIAEPSIQQAENLDSLLFKHRRERKRWRFLAMTALLLIAGSIIAIQDLSKNLPPQKKYPSQSQKPAR